MKKLNAFDKKCKELKIKLASGLKGKEYVKVLIEYHKVKDKIEEMKRK